MVISNTIDLNGNPLSDESITTHIPALLVAGINVKFDDHIPSNLDKLVAENLSSQSGKSNGSYKLTLKKGLNMVSIPVKTSTPITAKSLAQQLKATLVIRLDADNQEFVGYVPDHLEATNFDISGGMGVIVNLR